MGGEAKLTIDVELSSVFEGAGLSRYLSVEMEEQEATVKGLLHRLSEIGGDKIKPFLFEKGGESVLPGLMVMVNDRVLTGTALSQQGVELQDRDKVSLLYFISGG
jgi:sulfur carrier protein ThiS